MNRQIQTKRTILRRHLDSDFDEIKKILTDSDVMSLTGFKKALTEEKSREMLVKWIDDDGVWAVTDKNTNSLIGWFMLKNTVSNYPEIGFMLAKQYWGQGYATEVALELLSYAKSILCVTKVIASTNTLNKLSIKVLEKIGMQKSRSYSVENDIIYYEVQI